MYLSQLVLNLHSRHARRDLADRYELHRTILQAFPAQLPADERVLYRVDDQQQATSICVLVQSHDAPNWEQVERIMQPGYLKEDPNVRRIEPNVAQGVLPRFRLQANPTS